MAVGDDHWIQFGDGNAAMIIESKEYIKKSTGKKYIRFILIPSKRIESMYDLKDEQDPETGAIVREYSIHDVVFLERGINRTRCWVYTDINEGETPASRRFKDLVDTLKDNERELRSLQAAKNRAIAELDLERQQKLQSIKLTSDIVREVAKARGRPDMDGEDVGSMEEIR